MFRRSRSWSGSLKSAHISKQQRSFRKTIAECGRDVAEDNEFAEEAVDFFLIELWPAAYLPDKVVRTTSANAAYWHREVGNRR